MARGTGCVVGVGRGPDDRAACAGRFVRISEAGALEERLALSAYAPAVRVYTPTACQLHPVVRVRC